MKNEKTYLFTSESVSEGHPDKICDQISDAVLDAIMAIDPEARTAVETLVTTNKVVIAGEVRGPVEINKERMEQIAREVIKDIGYEQEGFHWQHADIEVLVHEQSTEIAQGVDASDDKEEGAGDQGIMFGFASKETDVFMPAPIYYSHKILKDLADARHSGAIRGILPDSKGQVTLLYQDGRPLKAESIVVSTQHEEGLDAKQVKEIIRPIVEAALPAAWMCEDERFFVNPTGKFVIGGPDGDCGLTGRKIIVDTYGGAAPHGGGAFSGKDPTKVDRSAAYAARYLAKNVVASEMAEKCTIQLAYAIGVSRPIALYVDTHGTGNIAEEKLSNILQEVMDLSPRGIRQHLQLNKPIYRQSAAYGHFGRAPTEAGGFSWERLDLVDELKGYLKAA